VSLYERMNAAMVCFSGCGLRHHQLVGGRLVGLVQLLALSAAALAAAVCFAAKFARLALAATLKRGSGRVSLAIAKCCLQSQINAYIYL
jgi:hypothetical protein